MYSRHKITYIDELPPLDELENQAVQNRVLIEHYQPTTNSTPPRISKSPYASSTTMYGGDPNLKNPQQLFQPKVNIQDEMYEKDKLFEKASQKIPSRIDGPTLAMPAKLGPNSMEKEYYHSQKEYEDYGIDVTEFVNNKPTMSYSPSEYVIPDASYIIYEESNNKRMNHPPPQKKQRAPIQRKNQPCKKPPAWNNKIPSYNPYLQYHNSHLQYQLQPPPLPHPPPHHIPHYYNGHQYMQQPPHICSLISTHLTECPLCMRLYVARKQFSCKDDDKSRNISSAIYMIIIIFLIICCIYMFKRIMNKNNSSE